MSDLGERFLTYIMSLERDSMDIKFHQMDDKGQVSFVFSIEGIEDESLRVDIDSHQADLLTAVEPFYVSMIGQMIIRKNMTPFFEFFRDMSDEDYNTKLSALEYISFGMGYKAGYVTMVFHSSLLYNVFISLLKNLSNNEGESK